MMSFSELQRYIYKKNLARRKVGGTSKQALRDQLIHNCFLIRLLVREDSRSTLNTSLSKHLNALHARQ